ncbi:uncharacterized protein FTOL_13866 [Fusarium torulosum]|uniref:Uncharacterized protein n=1 Tax=Fusarium torulosum TaxID=33205 RepID=A0AAE8MPL5_9HYPO|nr:uncharacterized protein FTOL_13866 [Fusarium torulosum]
MKSAVPSKSYPADKPPARGE